MGRDTRRRGSRRSYRDVMERRVRRHPGRETRTRRDNDPEFLHVLRLLPGQGRIKRAAVYRRIYTCRSRLHVQPCTACAQRPRTETHNRSPGESVDRIYPHIQPRTVHGPSEMGRTCRKPVASFTAQGLQGLPRQAPVPDCDI